MIVFKTTATHYQFFNNARIITPLARVFIKYISRDPYPEPTLIRAVENTLQHLDLGLCVERHVALRDNISHELATAPYVLSSDDARRNNLGKRAQYRSQIRNSTLAANADSE